MFGGMCDGGCVLDFCDVNSVFGELINFVWGVFKNCYFGDVEVLVCYLV